MDRLYVPFYVIGLLLNMNLIWLISVFNDDFLILNDVWMANFNNWVLCTLLSISTSTFLVSIKWSHHRRLLTDRHRSCDNIWLLLDYLGGSLLTIKWLVNLIIFKAFDWVVSWLGAAWSSTITYSLNLLLSISVLLLLVCLLLSRLLYLSIRLSMLLLLNYWLSRL